VGLDMSLLQPRGIARVEWKRSGATVRVLRRLYSTTQPVAKTWPSIGIVGGGVAGLSLANLLIHRFVLLR